MMKAASKKDALVHAAEKAEDSETLPEKQANSCHSFKWYATEVNHNFLISTNESRSLLDVKHVLIQRAVP